MKNFVIATLLVSGLASAAVASPRAASSPKERVKLVRIARNLEINPLAFEAVQQRQWAAEFIVKAPDLHLELCEPVLHPLERGNPNYNSQLSMQFMVSSAAFMVKHPKVKDPVKIQTAGVEGTLKAYQSILKVDKDAHFDFLDGLMQQKQDGQLENYVASISSTCGEMAEQAPRHKRKLIP
ncbi:hypothetical protein Acid345_0249 [Candidatus Koribacter versatilis Ellin345]|uniref:Uncharacterized protein n=1 Tax=Koribacter versatilis (strain Ellin345) TaxID=204669 RepID=Q1IV46_KORVE|nr:hypothetical protein [Candidatus Koribacter versatilis]ABF39254.1 hypothetical protein Acid345_0249 [Candidatus Koribacter versatilis Ellin345]